MKKLIFLAATLAQISFAKPSPEQLRAAQDLLVEMQLKESMAEMIPTMVDMQIQRNPAMSPYRTDFIEFVQGVYSSPGVAEKIAEVYANHFSVGELQELIAFYQTPIGKKMLKEQGLLTTEVMQVSAAAAQEHIGEFQLKLQEKMAKEKEPLPSPKPKKKK